MAELFIKVEAAAFGAGGDTPSATAVRLNLTRGDGVDLVQVIEPTPDEEAAASEMRSLFERMLPQDRRARVDILAKLLWSELSAEPVTTTGRPEVAMPGKRSVK